jgi:hypothetical protein
MNDPYKTVIVHTREASGIKFKDKIQIEGIWKPGADIDIDIFVKCNWVDTRWQQ